MRVPLPPPTIMGIRIGSTSIPGLLTEIESCVLNRRAQVFVGLYPALSLQLRTNPRYREIMQHSHVYPDGIGVVWALRLDGHQIPQRMATTDLVWNVLQLAEDKEWSVMFYGGSPGVVERVLNKVTSAHEKLIVAGARDGYTHIDAAELKCLKPDILFVARGAPLQEIWSTDVAIPAGIPVVLTCGGLFDFLAGEVRRAPPWISSIGLEWVFRIIQEPRRLLLRYAVGNTLFLARVIGDWLWRVRRLAMSRESRG